MNKEKPEHDLQYIPLKGGNNLDVYLSLMRNSGWSVAVHNDYPYEGRQYTFWLFTHPDGNFVKGESCLSDRDAVLQCLNAAGIERPQTTDPAEQENETIHRHCRVLPYSKLDMINNDLRSLKNVVNLQYNKSTVFMSEHDIVDMIRMSLDNIISRSLSLACEMRNEHQRQNEATEQLSRANKAQALPREEEK